MGCLCDEHIGTSIPLLVDRSGSRAQHTHVSVYKYTANGKPAIVKQAGIRFLQGQGKCSDLYQKKYENVRACILFRTL